MCHSMSYFTGSSCSKGFPLNHLPAKSFILDRIAVNVGLCLGFSSQHCSITSNLFHRNQISLQLVEDDMKMWTCMNFIEYDAYIILMVFVSCFFFGNNFLFDHTINPFFEVLKSGPSHPHHHRCETHCFART